MLLKNNIYLGYIFVGFVMAQIPSKQLHRSGTLDDLQANLSNREIGFCTTDRLAYYKLNGILFPMGSGVIPDPEEVALFMSYEDPENEGDYLYGWKQFTETAAPYDIDIKLWSRIAGKGLFAESAAKDTQGRNIADTLDEKTDAVSMTPGTYTKVTVNEQGAVVGGQDFDGSDLPDNSVPVEKLEIHKRLYVDGVTLYAIETADSVILCVKDGGIGHKQIAPGILFNIDPNYAANYASPHTATDLTTYVENFCDGAFVNVVFLDNGPNAFELNNGFITGATKRFKEGDYVLVTNKSASLALGVRTEGGASDIKSIPAGSSSLFVCQYSGNDTLTDASVWVPVS